MRFYFVFCSLEKIMIFTQGCVSGLAALRTMNVYFFFFFSRCSPLRCRSRRRRSFHCKNSVVYIYLFYYAANRIRSYMCVRVSYMELDEGKWAMDNGHCEKRIIAIPAG